MYKIHPYCLTNAQALTTFWKTIKKTIQITRNCLHANAAIEMKNLRVPEGVDATPFYKANEYTMWQVHAPTAKTNRPPHILYNPIIKSALTKSCFSYDKEIMCFLN